jgi:Domain of unknown function (DUF4864)
VAVAAMAAAILLAGCSTAPGATPDAIDSSSAAPSTPAPSAPPPPPTDEPDLPECGADVAEGVDATVAAQLAAFAAGDYRAAFRLASESFRASTDLKGFRAIILEGYPEVAAAASHRIVECREQGPGRAVAVVAVTGENGVTAQLGYRFVLEPQGWRIDGASTLGTEAVQTA